MLILLRIFFGAAFFYVAALAWDAGHSTRGAEDLGFAFYFALAVALAVANAAVWAPYLGEVISAPITGTITHSTYFERANYLLRLLVWLHDRGHRRLARCLAFLEGIHHPERPAAFLFGLDNSAPGSWLEKVFAREVFRFDNAQNCLRAYQVLKRHGIKPRPHPNPSINMVLLSSERSAKPEPEVLPVPEAPPPAAIPRNPRIALFEPGEAPRHSPPEPKAPDE